MDKSIESTATTTTSSSSSSSGRDQYLKNLNKLSLKISKPVTVTRNQPVFDYQDQSQNLIHQQPLSQPPQLSQAETQTQTHDLQQQQHQPPVYNINKNDFRDVVQKLTGSPAHERFSTPPPILPPKAPSSRLQRIRPSPLANVSNRPPPLLNNAIQPQQHQPLATINPLATATAPGGFIQFPGAPLSPLPPLPSVHGAAESPVSAYMRFFQSQNSMFNVDPNSKQLSGFSPLAPLNSPRWNNSTPQPPLQILPHSSASGMPATQQQFQLPSSPLAFGCSNSLRSPYPLLSPGPLFSPSSGPLGFPLSPTVQVPLPSPKWRCL
ncbi:VQ motif-containing protein 9-like [Tripterygium wilfordii]|uniref:VQ motif-containing protein 9-like n=1 Tax=Tripterygium wilfordii TaxID=458696 RepID=UPI0018F7FA18|nr:VQ motif-containing protein 9-like [Tripterygium wilfordii]XP_038703218.1 VQ motif-containing protein 9-like [Tripterygium wilfordii]